MDDSTSTRALIVLLGILSDPDLWIGKRLEAAETLLTYECPTDVVDAAKQFLLGVAEGGASVELRLKALKLLRQAEARRIRPRATRTHHAEEAQIPPEAARFVRRRRLEEAGLWPAPEGWDADLQVVASEDRPTSPFHGMADAVRRARLTAPFPREVLDGRDSAA